MPPFGSWTSVALLRVAAGSLLFTCFCTVGVLPVYELSGLGHCLVTSSSPRGAEECDHVMLDTRPRKGSDLKNPDLICLEIMSTTERH